MKVRSCRVRRGVMRTRVAGIFSEERSFYGYANSVMRMLTVENVHEVMASLPTDFREKFVPFAREVYLPRGGERFVIGRPLPDLSLDAIRAYPFGYFQGSWFEGKD